MKWEYKKVITTGTISEGELNKLGSEGWNNYAISGNTALFKRIVDDHSMVNPLGNNTAMVMPESGNMVEIKRNAAKSRK